MKTSQSKTGAIMVPAIPGDASLPQEASGFNFESAYARYADQLLRFCQSRLGVTAAEDVFQQVWLKVLKQSQRFTGGNERAWLFQIARTTIIDWVRKKKPEPQSEVLDAAFDADARTVLDNLVAGEDQARFRHCLSQLAPEKRKLIELRVTGCSYQLISQQLAIAIGTVGSQYNRICEQLRHCVGQATS